MNQVKAGDIVTLNGKISEYRSTVDYLFLTELASPTNITKISSGNPVAAIVLGANGLHPPTQQYSSLDVAAGGTLAVPNNVSQIETSNPTLQPDAFGMDFWQSLVGSLVTITKPTAVSYPNNYHDFWVRGDWPVTGLNERGGLTITMGNYQNILRAFNTDNCIGDDSLPDLNPETVTIGSPLDGTTNPDVW